MNRRNFLKALGLGGTVSAVQACGLDSNRYYTPIEQILPYVVRPEQVVPGTPTYFATAVGTGSNAWPLLAVHRDGRVINVAANPQSGKNPSIPKEAFFTLQRHYSPDRFQAPQTGGNAGTATTWDEGLKTLTEAAKGAKSGGKKIAYLGPHRSGTVAKLISEVADTAVFWEPLGRQAEANAAEQLFGARRLPRYQMAEAHYVLSFGADFLGNWGGPQASADFAHARKADNGHFVARFAAVTPYRDQTHANADDLHQVTPGSQVKVALAVASIVAKKKGYSGPALAMLNGASVEAAATASGLTAETIQSIAESFAASPAVALPGGVVGADSTATQLAAATMLLNIVSGHGLMDLGGYAGPVHAFKDVKALIDEMNAGSIGVLLIDDVNPIYNLPEDAAFEKALANVGTVVSLASNPSETTDKAKLILPASTSFEDWGDEDIEQGVTLLRQPAMTALYDTRSLGDILLVALRAVNPAAFAGDWRTYLMTRWANDLWPIAQGVVAAPVEGDEAGEDTEAEASEAGEGEEAPVAVAAIDDRAFQTWWAGRLSDGHFTHASPAPAAALTGSVDFTGDAEFEANGSYFLTATAHSNLGDGRFANEPWAQELPDPMTGQVWDTWAEIHPETAAKLGVSDNDQVKLSSGAFEIALGVEVTKSVRPDCVAVQFGGGHTASGRYANEVGKNLARMMRVKTDKYGALAWQQTKVEIAKTGSKADLISTFGHDSDEDRNFAARVDAEKYAKVGDAEAHHAGELTGIHHLPLDERLIKSGAIDFYPLTDHPTYRFGLTVDTDACTGCGACSVACYAENNLPVVGKHKVKEGREMAWIRINRYFKDEETHFVPMMCQQCGHAPCESVCPVLATYHTIDGLNAMVYNRCAGTRYCSNACPYSARKFNYHSYAWPEPFNLQLNPDVVVRTMGVMEKCSFCVQRIRRIKSAYRDQGFTNTVPEEALERLPACAEACPSNALTFGNLENPESPLNGFRKSARHYEPLAELNVMPAVSYLAKASFHHDPTAGHHGGGHGEEAGHGDAHGNEHDAKSDEHGEAGHEGKADDHHEPAHDANAH